MQGELEAVKREVTAASEKERQTRVKNKHLSTKLKQEEDEVGFLKQSQLEISTFYLCYLNN